MSTRVLFFARGRTENALTTMHVFPLFLVVFIPHFLGVQGAE